MKILDEVASAFSSVALGRDFKRVFPKVGREFWRGWRRPLTVLPGNLCTRLSIEVGVKSRVVRLAGKRVESWT